jgi:starch synthase
MAKLLFVTSEASPLIKTGGLADVSGSLPVALQELRWSVRLLLPAYPAARERIGPTQLIARLQIAGVMGEVQLLEGRLPGTRLPVWLVDYAPAFARDGNPYLGSDDNDWPDNAERFALLARCVVEIAQGRAGLRWVPDVVHCNDWQTGLVPALLSIESQRPATVFTLHNLAYQGLFPAETFQALGLPPLLWSPEGLEFYGRLSFIKGGLAYADHLTTVSPHYAREILTPEFGYGLEGLLQHRSQGLTGIINGIDNNVWNPASDPHIAHLYSVNHFRNKARNKRALQTEFGLPVENDKLLLGSIGRLVEQKGIDLILAVLGRLVTLPVQLVLLGSGERHFEQALTEAARRHSTSLAIRIGYDEGLAHRIEAGADAFLMPSRFEPCGLNQLYSLRYGTPPIVHAVGGLSDSVVNAIPATRRAGTATGFCFEQATAEDLLMAVKRAVTLFAHSRQWTRLAKTGMRQDFSWRASARQYAKLYQALL